MAKYVISYTYNGYNSYSVHFPDGSPMPQALQGNVPELVEAEHFSVLENTVRSKLSGVHGVEFLGVRCSRTNIGLRHALFAAFDISVPEAD